MPNSIGMATHCITQLMKWNPVAFHSKTLKCLKSPNKPDDLWWNPSNALSFIFTSGIYTFYPFHKSLMSKSSSYCLLTKDSSCFFFASQKKILFVLEKKKATLQVQGLSLTTFNGTTCSERLGVRQHTWHNTRKTQIPQCEQAINNRPKLPFSFSSQTTRSLKFTCVDTISV